MDVTADEWGEDADEPLSHADRAAIAQEAAELESYAALAASIEQNAKREALLEALAIAFNKAEEIGADPQGDQPPVLFFGAVDAFRAPADCPT